MCVLCDDRDVEVESARRIAAVLEAQNAAALALHQPPRYGFDGMPQRVGRRCKACDRVYPCPTARALGVTE